MSGRDSAATSVAPADEAYRMLARVTGAQLLLFGASAPLTVFGLGGNGAWKGLAVTVWAVSVAAAVLGLFVVPRSPARGFWMLVALDSACILAVVARSGLLEPNWTWFLVPVVLVGASPGRRWSPLHSVSLVLAVAAAGGAAYLWGTYDARWDPLRVAVVGVILVGSGDLARRSGDAYWIEVNGAHASHTALERAASASTSFASSTARYLSRPVTEIRRAAGTLVATSDADTQRDACRSVVLAADAVDFILDEILDRERLAAGLFAIERAPVEVCDVLLGAAAAAGTRIRIVGERPRVVADAALLGDAFTALFEATREAPPTGWDVRVATVRGGVRVTSDSAGGEAEDDPRRLVRLALAAAIIEAHGGTLRRQPALEVWLPAGGADAVAGGDVTEIVRARDAVAHWFVMVVLSVTAVGLALRRSWPGDLALFLVAQTALVVADRFAGDLVADRRVRTAGTMVVAAVFGLLVGASGGLVSPVWAIAGLPAAAADVQGRRVALAAGLVGTIAVGTAVVLTWSPGTPYIFGLAPVAFPFVSAAFLIGVSDGIEVQRANFDALNTELAASRAATSTFLAVVSHELRTPLTSVRGYAESLLLPRQWDEDTRREFVDAIRDEAGRLDALAGDLRDSAMIQSGTLTVDVETADPGGIVQGVAARYETLAGGTVRVRVPEDMPAVLADPRRVEQVLANLLDNAGKHAPGSSPVDVVAEADTDSVRISVIDHGPGMPAGLEEAAFEPFRRAGPGVPGVGLGLYVCKGIIDAHGPPAGIRCEATPGGGTTVVVSLPLAGAVAAQSGGKDSDGG